MGKRCQSSSADISFLSLSQATGGVVSVDYYTVSHVVIKPNQDTQTRETNREQSGEGKSDAGRRNKECVCDREEGEGKKKQFKKSSLRQVFMTSCVGLDGRGSKGAMCHWGKQRLFKARQPANILSQRHLVCLERQH